MIPGFLQAQLAYDQDCGPDPFAYPPDTIFCDGCGYRVPKSECVLLKGRVICEDCLSGEVFHYIEDYASSFVADNFEAFLRFLFKELFGIGCHTHFTKEQFSYVSAIYRALSEEKRAECLEQFAADPNSGFAEWVLITFGGETL